MPAVRQRGGAARAPPRSAGYDRDTKTWWCACSVHQCRTSSRALNEVSKRTFHYHKKQQAAADEEAAAQKAAADAEEVGMEQQLKPRLTPARQPLGLLNQDGHSLTPAADGAYAYDSSPAPQASAFNHGGGQETLWDFEEDDYMLAQFSAPVTPAARAPPRYHEPEEEPAYSSSEGEEDDDAGELPDDFGDGVEPEHILDEDRFVYVLDEEEEEDVPQLQASSSTSAPSEPVQQPTEVIERTYDDTTAAFMTLIASLSGHWGLNRQAAGMLLSFYSNNIFPLIPDSSSQPPLLLATVRRQLGLEPHLVRYAVCPGCETLARAVPGTQDCQACGEPLYERPGKPKIVFLYQPLTSWLTWLLQQPGIEDALQEWRDREPYDALHDIYDGSAWSSERDKHDYRFTDRCLSLLCALGIDWFSPFRSQYTSWHSTGAIMATILNLPQRLRYQQSTTYLAGCTPGPKEPSATKVGSYLQPLLDELLELSNGKHIPTHSAPSGRLVRLRILFYCGDTVGRNKICGFPTHSVRKGQFCGMCKVDCANKAQAFIHPSAARDADQHRTDSKQLEDDDFDTVEDRDRAMRTSGARPTPLNELPYWRSVQRAPIDHMHCIELGLIKRLFHRTLINGKVITAGQLKTIQACFKSSSIPASEQAPDHRLGDPGGGSATAAHWSTLGRRLLVLVLFVAWRSHLEGDIPLGFTPEKEDDNEDKVKAEAARTEGDAAESAPPTPATSVGAGTPGPSATGRKGKGKGGKDDQGKKKKQPRPMMQIDARATLFNVADLSAAATLASRRSITPREVDNLEALLLSHGRGLSELYGENWTTYNTHIATHIAEHVRRFGPAWNFSAYHFEGMNGQLGRTSTNRHRNGEIEATYTTAFASRGRLGMFLARDSSADGLALEAKIPVIKMPQILRLDRFSVLGRNGDVDVSLQGGQSSDFDPPRAIYQQLFAHLQKTRRDGDPALIPSYSSAKEGVKVVSRMKAHPSLKYGHMLFSSSGSRTNANISRTLAIIDSKEGDTAKDLFKIETILSHELRTAASGPRTSVFLLGRRARRAKVTSFDEVLSDPVHRKVLSIFWAIEDSWEEQELLPASFLSSDAATISHHGLIGISPGEDQRHPPPST